MKYCLKVALSGLLLFFIASQIDIRTAMNAAQGISAPTVIGVILLQLAAACIAAYRWSRIMEVLGCEQPLSFYVMSYFKGFFFNQGLPTSIGGDGLRILDCSRVLKNRDDAFYGVFLDRIIGLCGLLILNLLAMICNFNLLPVRTATFILCLTTALLTVFVGLYFAPDMKVFSRIALLHYLHRLSAQFKKVFSSGEAIYTQICLSMLIHSCALLSFFLLGRGLGLTFGFPVYLSLVPPVILLTILPFSLAGWGIREGAMVGLFLLVGADQATVLSFSILYGLLTLLASFPGLGIFIIQKQRMSPLSSSLLRDEANDC